MEVINELHAPAALPPGKEPPVLIGYEAGSGHGTEEKNSHPLSGIET
jgi:hypothetical protein